MKTILALVPVLLLLLPTLAAAQAPLRADATPQWEQWTPPMPSAAAITGDAEVGAGDVALTIGAAAVGFGAVLLVAGAVMMRNFDGTSPARGDRNAADVIFVVGGTAATALGAHLGNRSRGNLLLTALGTGAAMAATTTVLTRADEPAPVLYVAVPALTVGTAAVVQLVTTR